MGNSSLSHSGCANLHVKGQSSLSHSCCVDLLIPKRTLRHKLRWTRQRWSQGKAGAVPCAATVPAQGSGQRESERYEGPHAAAYTSFDAETNAQACKFTCRCGTNAALGGLSRQVITQRCAVGCSSSQPAHLDCLGIQCI